MFLKQKEGVLEKSKFCELKLNFSIGGKMKTLGEHLENNQESKQLILSFFLQSEVSIFKGSMTSYASNELEVAREIKIGLHSNKAIRTFISGKECRNGS